MVSMDSTSYPTPWVRFPTGITELDTALLTHKTNTCKLFKDISIKLPGWLRAIHPLSGAPSSPDPCPVWEVLKEGQSPHSLPRNSPVSGAAFRQAAGCQARIRPLAERAQE